MVIHAPPAQAADEQHQASQKDRGRDQCYPDLQGIPCHHGCWGCDRSQPRSFVVHVYSPMTTLNYKSAKSSKGEDHFNPDDFRMTVGEHLEDLRRRLILGLTGYVVAFAICLALGKHVIWIFCRPLEMALIHHDINPQVYFTDVAGPFVVYMEISMISAAVLASPWLIYQLWQFVAAGLYPKERRLVTKYLPLSIALLIAGVITLYFLVLPLSLEFFIEF